MTDRASLVAATLGTRVTNLDLSIGSDDCVVLVGQNGAGKSTALQLLSGLVAPTSGSALLSGRPAARLPESERAALVAWLPQRPNVDGTLTATEVVSLARFRHVETPNESGRQAEAFLAGAGAKHLAGVRIDSMSVVKCSASFWRHSAPRRAVTPRGRASQPPRPTGAGANVPSTWTALAGGTRRLVFGHARPPPLPATRTSGSHRRHRAGRRTHRMALAARRPRIASSARATLRCAVRAIRRTRRTRHRRRCTARGRTLTGISARLSAPLRSALLLVLAALNQRRLARLRLARSGYHVRPLATEGSARGSGALGGSQLALVGAAYQTLVQEPARRIEHARHDSRRGTRRPALAHPGPRGIRLLRRDLRFFVRRRRAGELPRPAHRCVEPSPLEEVLLAGIAVTLATSALAQTAQALTDPNRLFSATMWSLGQLPQGRLRTRLLRAVAAPRGNGRPSKKPARPLGHAARRAVG